MPRKTDFFGFFTETIPGPNARVSVLCQSKTGPFVPDYLCTWSDGGWVHAETKRPIYAEILGWRPPEPSNDPMRIMRRAMQVDDQ